MTTDMTTRFRTLILDVDSTVSGIEGIDWLARRRGAAMERRIAAMTDDAMRGHTPLERIYGARLEAIEPTRDDIGALAEAYAQSIAPGCADVVARLRSAGVRVVLISGGLHPAILLLARALGIVDDLHAVDIRFTDDGTYVGFDAASPLTTSDGKRTVVERLGAARPIVAVGDGSTDLAMKPAVDKFAAFVGFVRREAVVAGADTVVSSFAEVERIVLGD